MPRKDGFHRITNVSRPTLTLFPALRKAGGAAAAMIVCPGGGYGYTVIDKEGAEIAAWLNSAGISALVLKYRTPNNRAGALQDAQRALSLARERAAEWNVDPQRLVIIGFSAGGHLAAKTSTSFGERSYPAIDAVELSTATAPDVVVLVTGDADFAPLALQLRHRGIRVEAASLAQTLGAGLKTAVNEAIDLRGGGGEWRRSVGGRAPPLPATFEPLA